MDGVSPRYRIQAVAERTGVPTATLRAWERRYGVPEPARSVTRYRLYTDDDVALIRRMAALCATGVRPAEAAVTLRTERGRGMPTTSEGATLPQDGLVDRIVHGFLRMDLDGIRASLDLALSSSTPMRTYDGVVAPALRKVGDLWKKGALSIAQEHAGSNVVRDVLGALLRHSTPPPPAPFVLLACFDQEQHDIGLLGLGLHLTSWGYRVLFLGARVPPKAIRDAIEVEKPALVALSLVIDENPEESKKLLAAYARACDDVPWMIGGPAAADLASTVKKRGGHLASTDMNELRAMVDRLAR